MYDKNKICDMYIKYFLEFLTNPFFVDNARHYRYNENKFVY